MLLRNITLILSVILLAHFVFAQGREEMFHSCSNIDSNFSLRASGGDFEAISCNFPSKITMVSLEGGTAASVSASIVIEGGTVAAGAASGIWLVCPTTNSSQLAGPVRITITNITFGEDATVRFTGALPPNSSLLIANNSFNLVHSTIHTFTSHTDYSLTAAILIGTLFDALVLEDGARMVVVNNTLTSRRESMSKLRFVVACVICPSATLRSKSVINLSGNSIVQSRLGGQAFVAHMYIYSNSSSLMIHDESSLVISENSFLSSISSADAYAAYLLLDNTSVLSLEGRSALVMNGNTISNSSATGNVAAAYLQVTSLISNISLHQSTLDMSGNGFLNIPVAGDPVTGVAYVVYLAIASSGASFLQLHSQSNILINMNRLVNSSIGRSLYVAYLSVTTPDSIVLTISNQSAITMRSNSMVDSNTESAAMIADISLSGKSSNISLSLESTIDMSENILLASNVGGILFVAYFYIFTGNTSSDMLLLSEQSNFVVSANGIVNSMLGAMSVVAVISLYKYSGEGIAVTRFELRGQSSISMEFNTVANGPRVFVQAFVASLSVTSGYIDLLVSNKSMISLSGNTLVNSSFDNTVYLAYLCIIGTRGRVAVAQDTQSVVTLCSNSFVNSSVGAGSSFASFAAYFNLEGQGSILSLLSESSFILSHNTNYRTLTSGDVSLACIKVFGPVVLSGKASIHMDGNSAHIGTGNAASPLLITVESLIVSDASSISIAGNQMYGHGAASLLAIHGNLAANGLSISGGSSFYVGSNTIIADALLIQFVRQNVNIQVMSSFVIVRNNVNGTSPCLALFSESLVLDGHLVVLSNKVVAPVPIVNYSLVSVLPLFTNGSMAMVQTCGNRLSWDSNKADPSMYLQPPGLAALAAKCPDPSTTSTTSSSVTSSTSGSVETDSRTKSSSKTTTNSPSKASITNSPSVSVSPSASLSRSGSPTVSVRSLTHSLTHSWTQSPSKVAPIVVIIVPVPAAVETAKQVQSATGVAVAVTAVASATGGQLGVANALMRLADCSSNADGNPLPILVHPLQFSFGDKKSLKHAAGAVSDTLLVPLIVAAIALVPARLLIMWSRSVSSRAALVQIGWPTLLVLPFANLAQGIGVTTMTALSSGEPFGVAMGGVALLVLLTFAGSWAWILARVVPRARLQLVREVDVVGLGKRRGFLWRKIRPSHRWVPLVPAEGTSQKRISFADVERYGNAIGDKQWYYAELASFVCSVVVGVCESLPPSLCRERAVIALVPALVQCGLAVLALIPLERFLQSVLAACLVPMYIVVAVKVFSDSGSNDLLDSTMAVLSAAGNVIGIMIMAFGLIVGLWEVATTHRTHRRSPFSPATAGVLDVPLLDVDSINHISADGVEESFSSIIAASNPGLAAREALAKPSPSAQTDESYEANSELATVRSILAQLREYEEQL